MTHALAAVLGLIAFQGVEGADWPQWRGPDRDGVTSETNWVADWPSDGPTSLWEADVGVGYASVAVAHGRCITIGNTNGRDIVSARDSRTGGLLWKHSYVCPPDDPNNRPGPRSTPTIDEGRVYTLSRQGHLFCLDVRTGSPIWKKHLVKDLKGSVPQWGYACSPLVVGDQVIVEPGGNEGVLGLFSKGVATVALDKRTGEVNWARGTESAGYSSPVTLSENRPNGVLVFHADGLVARRLRDGHAFWRFPWKTKYNVNASTPIINDERTFISSGYNTGAALIDFSGNNPSVVWKNRRMRNHFSSSVLVEGYIYGFDRKALTCLDFETGRVQWREHGYGKGTLIAADKRLIIQGDDGVLAVGTASPDRYREISRARVLGERDTWVPPALANGRIYCRHHEKLVCLDVRR